MENFFELTTREHYMGSRNGILGVDLEKNPENLDKFINSSMVLNKMSKKDRYITNLYKNGACLIYKDMTENSGLIMKIAEVEEKNIIASMYPFFNNIGLIYRAEIYNIYVWADGVNAQIGFKISDHSIEFLDTNFLSQREKYMPNKEFQARIYGVAFLACKLKDEEITFDIKTDEQARVFDKKIGESFTLHTNEMRSCVCGDENVSDIDEYTITGRINAIRKITLDFCGTEAFICSVDCITVNSSEFMDIEILITKDIWEEENPPQIDSFISAKIYFAGEILD
ncbi:hypothetical protein [Campylobacter fetus]|uniref:hypothetical protein n=2 Tax=Campylobacter fetus TaxID=196 RepID=UPI0003C261B5|nr:hypothetical protein [Campylobacter fetus]AGZ81651.1 hypothetical protein CFT03427_0783 [Campylobacter fetus subsp. testudinum 03-427]AJB45390.1 hypothetical protein CR44_03980 [Campylobacter fetus subsp. testudinum]EAI4321372.1 hypothetical protein [Campylobacter fetus]EAI4390628.1 hypothetical protein [Campylobacter fetus]OCR84678.1 hypothetical protein CFT12S05168_08720 [Campylobacter fetus subsp. testudinum]